MTSNARARRGAITRRRALRSTQVVAALAVAVLAAGCGSRVDETHMAARLSALGSAGRSGGSTGEPVGAASDLTNGRDPAASTAAAPVDGSGATSTSSPTGGTAGASGAGSSGHGGTAAAGQPAVTARSGSGDTVVVSAHAPGSAAAASAASNPPSAAAAGPVSTPGAAAKAPVVVGHIGDYSGVVGTVLKGGNVTAQIIARNVNDHGGLDGHPVQLVSADAGGDPARALSLVRDMVENKGAVAFVGNMWPLSGSGPRDYLEQHKIPVIGGDGSTAVWFQSPMYFPSAAAWPTVSFGAAKTLVDAGQKKIAVVYCVEVEPCKTWHDVAVAKAPGIGGQVVYDAQVSLAQPDFTAECIQAQRNGADGIMAGVDGPSIVRLARACAQQGYKPQFVTGSLAVIESIAKDPNLDGLMAPVGTFPHMADDLPGAKEYQQAIAHYAPTMASSPTTTTVWTAGALLIEAAKVHLPDKVTPAAFFPGLYAIKNNTLGGLVGPLSFSPDAPAGTVRCVFSIKVVGGRFTAPDGSKQQCL